MFLNLNDLYRYFFSLDYISFIIVFLTFLIIRYMYNRLLGDKSFSYSLGSFYISLMTFVLLLVFLTLDSMIFYFSFEFVVVPIFLIVLMMGRSFERLQSAIYLFLYTLVSSIPFLVFIIYFFINVGSLTFVSFFFFEHLQGYW